MHLHKAEMVRYMGAALVALSTSLAMSAEVLTDPSVTELESALSEPASEAPAVPSARGFPGSRQRNLQVEAASGAANRLCQESGSGRRSMESAVRTLEVVPYTSESTSVNLAIHFELGSAALTSGDRALLDRLAQAMGSSQLREARFAVAGHTDISGGDRINLPLSCARALSARHYLMQRGIEGARLSAYGFGSSQPIAGHRATDSENRRVEIKVVKR